LYEEFNAMLARIDFADTALHRAHEESWNTNAGLEERVRKRTDELLQANIELELSENRIRANVESAGDGISTTDEQGVIQTVNPAAESIFGYAAGDLIGSEITEFVQLQLAQYHDQGSIGVRREVEGIRQDGSRFLMELAVYDAGLSEQLVFTGFLRDLTAIKEAESQLAR
jgi:PAS domain S-box-containing protein